MSSHPIQFRAVRSLDDELAARQRAGLSRNAVAQRDLERYYARLRADLRHTLLGRNEALLLCDVLSATYVDGLWPQQAAALLVAEVEDSDLAELAEKWDVDSGGLLTTIRAWSDAQAWAVLDAIERWWAISDEVTDPDERLTRAGLAPKRRVQ